MIDSAMDCFFSHPHLGHSTSSSLSSLRCCTTPSKLHYSGMLIAFNIRHKIAHPSTRLHFQAQCLSALDSAKRLAIKRTECAEVGHEERSFKEQRILKRAKLQKPHTEAWKAPIIAPSTSQVDLFECEDHTGHGLRYLLEQNEMEIIGFNPGEKVEKMGNATWLTYGSGLIERFGLQADVHGRTLPVESKGKILRGSHHYRVLLALIAASIVLTSPPIMLKNGSIQVADNIANAQPLGQIRQAAVFLERLAGGTASGKILDKVMTVISGQLVVTPETVEELKSIIEGEEDIHDWKTELANNIGNFWSTAVDVVSHFDPLSLTESAGSSIQGVVEAGAERFAAFELSTLVALGERWLLWTPLVVLPMYWKMSRNSKNAEDDNFGEGNEGAVELSEEAIAKAEKVRRELERIKLKADLLDLVYSLGKMAWQSPKVEQGVKRRQIEEIMEILQRLNPMNDALSNDLGSILAGISQKDSLPQIEPIHDVDGDWCLIYVSQANDQSQQQQLPQFPSLDLPGVELDNMRQKVWRKGFRGLYSQEDVGDRMLAKNTAEIRLGFLGVMELSVQGTWENIRDGKGALVSFDTFSARPIELLGTPIREDLPPLQISIPRTLQTSGEWEVVYLDSFIRINRGRSGQLYLFSKRE